VFESGCEHTEADRQHRPGEDHQFAVTVGPPTHPSKGRVLDVGFEVVVLEQRLMLM
jgi:hypothetical protein